MCFDNDAVPPIPLSDNTGAQGEDVILTTSDGTTLAAYVGTSENKPRAQVVILPDVRGLHGFYRELALRFADAGARALAIDYFGRTAFDAPRDASFDYAPHVQQMTGESFAADLDAALDYLRDDLHRDIPTYTVGFCMGGSLSFRAGTRDLGLSGVVGFYAGLSRSRGAVIPADQYAARMQVPLLGLFGGADQSIPPSDIDTLEGLLEDSGVPFEIVVYPGAPHSFFDRQSAEFADASADAWRRIQDFIAVTETAEVQG